MSTPGVGNMVVGGLICVVGIGITLATYSAASGGGRYVVAWGAIVVGAIVFAAGAITALQHEAARSRPAAPGDTSRAAGGDGGDAANPGRVRRFNSPDRMLIQALASLVDQPAAPSAGEIHAIRAVMLSLPPNELHHRPVVQESDVRQAVQERSQEIEDAAAWLRKYLGLLGGFFAKRDILRGCFSVVMADGPRPHALAAAIMVGQALGFTESEVKAHIQDMTGPLNGGALEITIRLFAADIIPGREVEFQYDVLTVCAACNGYGCTVCGEQGRTPTKRGLVIALPPNVHDGGQVSCRGQGHAPLPGGQPGDLLITINAQPAPERNA